MRSPVHAARDFADKVRSYMGYRAGPPSPFRERVRERGDSQYGVSEEDSCSYACPSNGIDLQQRATRAIAGMARSAATWPEGGDHSRYPGATRSSIRSSAAQASS